MSKVIMVYTTIPSEEKSKEMVRLLLEKHLIACATIIPCKSMYWWDGAIQDDQECAIFAKTTENKFELLQEELTKIHPYKVPCIIKIPVTANAPYAQWLHTQMQPQNTL